MTARALKGAAWEREWSSTGQPERDGKRPDQEEEGQRALTVAPLPTGRLDGTRIGRPDREGRRSHPPSCLNWRKSR